MSAVPEQPRYIAPCGAPSVPLITPQILRPGMDFAGRLHTWWPPATATWQPHLGSYWCVRLMQGPGCLQSPRVSAANKGPVPLHQPNLWLFGGRLGEPTHRLSIRHCSGKCAHALGIWTHTGHVPSPDLHAVAQYCLSAVRLDGGGARLGRAIGGVARGSVLVRVRMSGLDTIKAPPWTACSRHHTSSALLGTEPPQGRVLFRCRTPRPI